VHILIAPNAFKNSLSADAAARAIADGLHSSRLACTSTCFPIADGGDGTGALIIEQCKGQVLECEVSDPLGRKIKSQFGLIDGGKTAVIEMADASGLRLLKREELNPMQANSAGTGELIKKALDLGVSKILIAMGGSATVDGGCGILHTLGVRFYDMNGKQLSPVPARLAELAVIDLSGLDKRIAGCEIIVLCDVNNKLLGPEGSAAVFGPQKGASPADVIKLDDFLSRLDKAAEKQTGNKLSDLTYGGAAGGAAAGIAMFLNAKLVNGIAYFLQVTSFETELQKANLLITGEGSIDSQTLQGKGPFGVAQMAKSKNIPVIGLAGKVPLAHDDELFKYFDVLLAIGDKPVDLAEALQDTRQNLVRVGRSVGDLLSISQV
jgi:glycerate kinase